MTTFSHLYGEQGAVASLNYFLKNNLKTNLPTWLTWSDVPPRTLNFDYPEQPFTPPSFGAVDLGSFPLDTFEGDRADGANKGIVRQGLYEVDCYVSSKGNFSWSLHLRDMRDMVFKLFEQNRAIIMYDFTNPSSPVSLGTIVRIREIKEVPVVSDAGNPALKRKRILVSYFWTERWAA